MTTLFVSMLSQLTLCLLLLSLTPISWGDEGEEPMVEYLRHRRRLRNLWEYQDLMLNSFSQESSKFNIQSNSSSQEQISQLPIGLNQNPAPLGLDSLSQTVHSRKKRAVFNWPSGSRFVADFQFEVPLRNPTGIIMPFSVEFPYRIQMPNVDFLDGTVTTGRSIDRASVFGYMEDFFQKAGMDGRSCMLRAICERAEGDVLPNGGLVGEIVAWILQMSGGADEDILNDYKDAEYHGRTNGDCWQMYEKCPISLFKWLQ